MTIEQTKLKTGRVKCLTRNRAPEDDIKIPSTPTPNAGGFVRKNSHADLAKAVAEAN